MVNRKDDKLFCRFMEINEVLMLIKLTKIEILPRDEFKWYTHTHTHSFPFISHTGPETSFTTL